jgi:iron complex transport system permease protein
VSATVAPVASGSRRSARVVLAVCLAVALMLAILASLASGQLGIPPLEVLQSLLSKLGIDLGITPSHPSADAALWAIRFPRVALAVLVGAALAAAGTLMQAVFGNPLAEAGVVGVSSGAALGAAAAIALGWTFFGEWTVPFLAFTTGLTTVFIVYFASRSGGKTEVVTLILTGIAVNAFAGAGLAFMTFIGSTSTREQIIFWQLGSLNGARWQQVGIVAILVVVGVAVSFAVTKTLDLFSLGDRSARHLGVNVEAYRIAIIVVVAVLVCAAVAFAGIISFVGLVVPHLMRMLIGPAHRPLLVTSVLGGSLLLVLADLVARTAVPLADLPIGMITSLVGGPFFFWLLLRTRRRAGGWA